MDLAALRKIPQDQILVFDLEHTGEIRPELLQFSALWANGKEAINVYIKPIHAKKWPYTEPIHHITPAMVKDCPTIQKVKPLIKSVMEKAKVIVGFSMSDDFRVLKKNHVFLPSPEDCIYIDIAKPFNDLYADTVESGKRRTTKSLKTCADYYGVHGDNWHNSLADALATAKCFHRMLANGDLAYVSQRKGDTTEKPKSLQPKMKGSKTRRKKRQESKRRKEKKENKRKPIYE